MPLSKGMHGSVSMEGERGEASLAVVGKSVVAWGRSEGFIPSLSG